MSLFKVSGDNASRLKPITNLNGKKVLERDVQRIFEASLHDLLGVHFLASEYSTSFGGRMDTLGIDDEGNPCIIEYKKGHNENVINQGLSYLRWLLDHKDSFEKLCNEKNITIAIQWAAPRVICVRPGEKGLSIIDGHLNGNSRDGIFIDLEKVTTGDTYVIEFGDGSKRDFRVKDVKIVDLEDAAGVLFSQDPSIASQLTLITCGGTYDKQARLYDKRIIVTSELL